MSYELGINGESAHLVDFLIGVSPDGSFAWTGWPQEFSKHGLKGVRRTVLEVDN